MPSIHVAPGGPASLVANSGLRHWIGVDVARQSGVVTMQVSDVAGLVTRHARRPLGDGPFWSEREEMSPDGPGERCRAALPAWEARSMHDLAAPRTGFAAAAGALGMGDPWTATQVEPGSAVYWPDRWNGLPVFSAWVARPGEAE